LVIIMEEVKDIDSIENRMKKDEEGWRRMKKDEEGWGSEEWQMKNEEWKTKNEEWRITLLNLYCKKEQQNWFQSHRHLMLEWLNDRIIEWLNEYC
jgi:hypothetical protein